MQIEGETPKQTRDDEIAARVARLASNGMGGFDWRGVELLADLYGVEDLELLVERLGAIKAYESPNKE